MKLSLVCPQIFPIAMFRNFPKTWHILSLEFLPSPRLPLYIICFVLPLKPPNLHSPPSLGWLYDKGKCTSQGVGCSRKYLCVLRTVCGKGYASVCLPCLGALCYACVVLALITQDWMVPESMNVCVLDYLGHLVYNSRLGYSSNTLWK